MNRCIAILAVAALSVGATSRDAMNSDFESVGVLLRYDEEGVRVAAEVKPREVFLSLPVSHRRTGVLLRDLHYAKQGRPGAVFVKAGSAAFSFAEKSGPASLSFYTWCFSENPTATKPAIKCIADRDGSAAESWVVGRAPMSKFMPILFEQGFGSETEAPAIELRSAKIHPDLRLECHFLGWGKRHVDLRCLLGGESLGIRGTFLRIDRDADSAVDLETPIGLLRLEPLGAGAKVSRISP
jgi:hypothetical protein